MLRQVLGIVVAHETGIGFRLGNAPGEHALGEIGVEFLVVGQGPVGVKAAAAGYEPSEHCGSAQPSHLTLIRSPYIINSCRN